jgi:hypothetical protein
MSKCAAVTKQNKQCSRNATQGSIYCTQHKNIHEKEVLEKEETKTEFFQDQKNEGIKENKGNNLQITDSKPKAALSNLQTNESKLKAALTNLQTTSSSTFSQIPNSKTISPSTLSVLKVTSGEFVHYYQIHIDDSLKYLPLLKEIFEDEKKLLKNEPIECKTNTIIISTDGNSLYNVLHSNFYDYNSLVGVLCATTNFLKSDDLKETSIKIHNWFSQPKLLAVGGNGYVFDTVISKKESLFAIKVNIDPNENFKLVHELFVGLYGTNKLRKLVPNFVYVFGGFQCGGLEMKNEKIKSYCGPDKNLQYILYEFVKGYDYRYLLETGTRFDFLSSFIQILFSLQIGSDNIDFTHFDLKPDNIVNRIPFDFIIYIPYKIGNNTLYVKSKSIPTILDYGYSHIKYENKDYGLNDLYEFGITGNKSFIISDIYKLLMDSLNTSKKNKQIFNTCIEIYRYFSDEDVYTALKLQGKDLFYYLPPIEKYMKYTPMDVYDYMKNNINLNEIVFEYEQLPKDAKILELDEHKFRVKEK